MSGPSRLVAQRVPPDSADLRALAEQAQIEFERIRWRNLPRGPLGRGSECDERLGSICIAFGDDEDWDPEAEDAAIAGAREDLLGTLSRVGQALPGDRWVLAQRVRYLGETGRWLDADRIAGRCTGGAAWWCPALVGYVRHRAGMVPEALEAFAEARAAMDPETERDWLDPRPLLDYPARGWAEDPGGMERRQAWTWFWTLADPLFLTPGNERLSEHLARHFERTFFQDATLIQGLPWSDAFEKLVLRYGFVARWIRVPADIGEIGGDKPGWQYHPDSRGLLPPLGALDRPGTLAEEEWRPQDGGPRSTSAPVPAPFIAEGSAQTAVFRRGGDIFVVAAYGPPQDTLLEEHRPAAPEAGDRDGQRKRHTAIPLWEVRNPDLPPDTMSGLFLVASRGSGTPRSDLARGGTGVLAVTAPPGEYLLSQELWNPSGRWGARVRHGVSASPIPPDVPALSDLILLNGGPDLPANLPQALPRMLTSGDVARGQPVTVAWEVYGLGARREPLSFSLTLVRQEGSLFRRALGRIGLFRPSPALTLSWTEGGTDLAEPLFRAVDLDLPELDPGRYLLRLEMEIPFRSKVLSERVLTVF